MLDKILRWVSGATEAQFIKLADMIDNSDTIFMFDRGFAPVFKAEMKDLVDEMTKVIGSSLWIEANRVLKT
jgi:hypothetical protein